MVFHLAAANVNIFGITRIIGKVIILHGYRDVCSHGEQPHVVR